MEHHANGPHSDFHRPAPALPAPGLAGWRDGNIGVEGVWRFESGVPGHGLLASALVGEGGPSAGWALLEALKSRLRPRRGELTLAFRWSGRRSTRLLPFLERADLLLDLQSTSGEAAPVLLPGLSKHNIEFALQMRASHAVVIDEQPTAWWTQDARFAQPEDNGARSLLCMTGHHGASSSHQVALDILARFLVAGGCVRRSDIPQSWWLPMQ